MPKVYIINTNKSQNPQAEADMIQNTKCSAYYTPWKYYIDTIEANDIVFLYSNEVGIIARGIATGIVEVANLNNDEEAEHYMKLSHFEELITPLKADKLTSIVRGVAGNDFKFQWNQTMILVAYPFGIKVWQYISKNCM